MREFSMKLYFNLPKISCWIKWFYFIEVHTKGLLRDFFIPVFDIERVVYSTDRVINGRSLLIGFNYTAYPTAELQFEDKIQSYSPSQSAPDIYRYHHHLYPIGSPQLYLSNLPHPIQDLLRTYKNINRELIYCVCKIINAGSYLCFSCISILHS